MSSSENFDVFLCHNSQEKAEVIEIANQLKQRGIVPWLDKWELRPGLSWQELLESQIANIRSAAVFVGSSGLGPWQKRELRAFLNEFTERDCPVIPILLPNASEKPQLPIFLKGMTWVDFRQSDAMENLIWGITGVKPSKQSNPVSETSSGSKPIEVTQPLLAKFNFDVVIVDAKGKEVNREKRQAEYISENLGNGVTLEMVSIPAGGFVMGASPAEQGSRDSERPQHQVSVPAFFMGKYQITQAQWRQVAAFPKVKTELNPYPSGFKGDNRPVEQVSWLEALEFCRRLSKKTGKEYRLPSEAEWEYACRAGTTTPFHFGETIAPELVNYDSNNPYGGAPKGEYQKKTMDVGSFKLANAFGLYDMHGNVWEWCADDWSDNYGRDPTDSSVWINNIKNAEAPETKKLMRGGSWSFYARNCRSASRTNEFAGKQFDNLGFRVVSILR